MQFPNFCGPAYTSQSLIADGERCVNLFPEVMEVDGAQAKVVLYPAPGLTAYCSTACYFSGSPAGSFTIEAPCRGMYSFASLGSQGDQAYAVGGGNLYLLPSSTTALMASLNPIAGAAVVCNNTSSMAIDDNPATLSWNGDAGGELFITSGGNGYLWSTSGLSWSGVIAAAGTGLIQGAYLDGFFLALDDSSTLHISEASDGATWDASQITQRTTGPDPWVSMLVAHRQIWLFGTTTTDIWWNAGLAPFPFAPIDGATLQVGILAPFSAAELDNAPIWLGRSGQGAGVVYRGQGSTPVRVSNHAVEYAIQHYSTSDDAIGWTYQQDGHEFYVLDFPTPGKTWVYDAAAAAKLGHASAWHERAYRDPETGELKSYRPRFHTFAHGRHLVGDRQTGAIYSYATDTATEVDGTGITRIRRTPHLSSERVKLFFQSLEIDLETGLGLTTGQGSDPQLMLRWSDDGGRTWSSEHWISAGAIGVYQTRAIWNRLGAGRDRVFEVTMTDPVPWRLVRAFLTVQQGLT